MTGYWSRLRGGVERLLRRWQGQSLAAQFLLAGGIVSLAAMLAVGWLVTSLIEAGVMRNSASATARYVDSVIAPILPNMQRSEILEPIDARVLDETLSQGALRGRLVSFRLWRRDGTILYASEKELVGRTFDPNPKLRRAFGGEVVASFETPIDAESAAEQRLGRPLLEIYNPVLQPWSGEVVAVSEFYEEASELAQTLRQARLLSLGAVAAVTLVFFLLLSAIVFRGSRMLDRQSRALGERVAQLSNLLAQNEVLRLNAQRASERVAALNEGFLRRVGADLHDGPAQLLALASLRLDSPSLSAPEVPVPNRERELANIRSHLDEAMGEIRSISAGLVLPQIETATLPEIVSLAVRAFEQRSSRSVALTLSNENLDLTQSEKICVYRFIQETLNNGLRHGNGADQAVVERVSEETLRIEVSDSGPGFDPARQGSGGIGLAGLRERVESLNGRFSIDSSANGTRVTMILRGKEPEAA